MELPTPKLSFTRFAQLHGVTPKTLDRWIARGVLPQPIYIRGRKYFDADTLPQQGEPRRRSAAGASS